MSMLLNHILIEIFLQYFVWILLRHMLSLKVVNLWSHLRYHVFGASYVQAGEAPLCATLQQNNQQTISTINRQNYMVSGNRITALFKEPEQSAKVFSAHPHSHSSESSTCWHMIAAHWACPLPFARARVHNKHNERGSSTHRMHHNKCKGLWDGSCCFANEDMAAFMLNCYLLSCTSDLKYIREIIVIDCVIYVRPHWACWATGSSGIMCYLYKSLT